MKLILKYENYKKKNNNKSTPRSTMTKRLIPRVTEYNGLHEMKSNINLVVQLEEKLDKLETTF